MNGDHDMDARHEPADDAEVHGVLRDAGARLRRTAPGAGSVDPRAATRIRDRRRIVAIASIGAAAAALVAILVVLPGRDESVRDVPTDTPTTVVDGTDLDTLPEVAPSTPPTTAVPTTDLPVSTIQLVERIEDRDWDRDRGRCYTLEIDWPGTPSEVPMCVTGFQIDLGVDAYVRGDGYAFRWFGTRLPDGDVGALAGGGTGGVGFDAVPPSDQVPCGPPAHEVPEDRWVMVSHCGTDEVRSGALYTLLPDSPTGPPAYLVGTANGMAVDANPVEFRDVESTDGRRDRLDVFEVPSALSGVLVRCVLVAPARADRWFETCRGADEAGWNSVLLHDGRPYLVEDTGTVGPPSLVPLPTGATLRSNGCMSPVVEVLTALADPDGLLGRAPSLMVSGLACPAATDAFETAVADDSVSAAFSGVLLRPGPPDGGLVTFERSPGGGLVVTDTGTGIEPDPMPLAIPPARWFWMEPDDLPPVDVTSRVTGAVGPEPSRAALVEAIVVHLAEQYPTEGGPPTDVIDLAGLPLVVAPSVGYFDDSVASGAFFFWLADRDGTVGIDRVILINRCARGLTEVDGVLLCV